MNHTLHYLRNLLTDVYVGSVTPTSRSGIQSVLERLDLANSRLILEYGPGTGKLTLGLLGRMSEHTKLVAVERNAGFCRVLRDNLRDPRLLIFQDSAERVLDILATCAGSTGASVDFVVSGIPFSFLSQKKRMAIIRNTHAVLKPGGKLVAYQAVFQLPHTLRIPLREVFGNVRARYAVCSFPSLVILEAIKRRSD